MKPDCTVETSCWLASRTLKCIISPLVGCFDLSHPSESMNTDNTHAEDSEQQPTISAITDSRKKNRAD